VGTVGEALGIVTVGWIEGNKVGLFDGLTLGGQRGINDGRVDVGLRVG